MNGPGPLPSLHRPMTDPFGRTISYLRVSVTDRSDLRCFYCMSEDMTFLPKVDLLTLEELDRLCAAFIAKGVKKLRLTGGEPLVRRNLMSLVRSLSRHLATGALSESTMTTNGTQLARFAQELADCGMRRISVSSETLMRRMPQSASSCAKRASWVPLVVMVDSLSAPVARCRDSERTSDMRLRRTRGSPPVSRSFFTPLAMKAAQSRSSSSSVSRSTLGRKVMSSDMQ